MSAYRLYMLMSLMLMIAILMPEAEHARSDVFQHGQKGKYCGRSLSSALQIICDSIYNTRFKKSSQEMEMDDYMALNYDPYKSIENARKILRFRRNLQGVHEECCEKACTTEELRSYCGAR